MSDDKPAKRSLTRRLLGLVVRLVLMSGIFWLGYYVGVGSMGNGQAGSLKAQLKDMTTTMFEQSPDLKVDLSLRQSLNTVKDMLLEAKEELRHKNFSKAQDEVDKPTILFPETYTMSKTQEQVETQIDELRTRLLDVQNDIANLKSVVTGKIDDIAQDIEQLRNTATSF